MSSTVPPPRVYRESPKFQKKSGASWVEKSGSVCCRSKFRHVSHTVNVYKTLPGKVAFYSREVLSVNDDYSMCIFCILSYPDLHSNFVEADVRCPLAKLHGRHILTTNCVLFSALWVKEQFPRRTITMLMSRISEGITNTSP